jgi:hypothetical protein
MATDPSDPNGLPQHPLVEHLKPDPSKPAKRVIVLTGLPGNSDRPGYQRIYLTTKLDYYAEFLTQDMVSAEAVPADQSPFPGQEATRVSIARDATIHYIRVRSPQPVDEFDLDIRLGAPGAAPALSALPARGISPANGCTDNCPTQDTCPHTQCFQTCHTQCGTCPANNTCVTCQTCHGENTCAGHGTCVNTQCQQAACIFTQGHQGTCDTCVFTACGQATCAFTQCQQATCVTCPAANTCAQTCVG